ncbi:MAG: TIGR04282 family arsenosugar biosynthesis glycosyltransferase [Candidatus Rokubacteria bacterium]|nr:TIGR04282 family arsenosugar biosynthesis glycosyltransferase [Candidatus Rokubacteria bacterium]
MAKAPTPGRVKTRLSPPLIPREAAALYRCLLLDTVACATSVRDVTTVVAYTPVARRATFEALCPGVALMPQRRGDLGTRLAGVFARLFARGFRAVVTIGSDTPTLPVRYLGDAVGMLLGRAADVVLGPARDGGYYLVGLRSPAPHLFTGMPWSTRAVCAITLARARHAGLSVASLPPWDDVDTIDDLRRLASSLARRPGTAAPRTRGWLAEGAHRR